MLIFMGVFVIGHFIQAMYNIFATFIESISSIKKEFKDKPEGDSSEGSNNIFKNAFSKNNAKLWLYFIPIVLMIFITGGIFIASYN